MKYLLFAFVAWCLLPMLLVLTVKQVPVWHRLRAVLCFVDASIRSLLIWPVALSAPFVLPFILPFVPREADHLPWWCRIYDNDVSINGDREEYWNPNYYGHTYYADAMPRSDWARYVWLGLRNRGSWLKQKLGCTWGPTDNATRKTWGDAEVGRDREGCQVNFCAGRYQLYIVRRLGSRLCLRINYGYKVWPQHDGRAVANVVNISASVLRWRGGK